MLWDRGTWTPQVDDVDAALKKGDLKFTLNGYKLKGSWVLVRTGGRYAGARGGGDRSWLLIKHRDEWAGEVDITEFAPLSVKSGGDFEDILAEDTPAIWQSHRPAKGGDAGAMLAQIIERAAKLKSGRSSAGTTSRPAADTDDTETTDATTPTKRARATSTRTARPAVSRAARRSTSARPARKTQSARKTKR
jgi:bifunctional non-homologous end joining protein LigD